jgi:2TM domain
MTSDPYKIAQKRVKAKKGFYTHLVIYLIVNAFLFAINMLTSRQHFWFVYPLLGWGVSIAIQYFTVFGMPGTGRLDEKWEAEEMEKELRRMGKGDDDFKIEPEDQLELKEFKKLRKDWEDSDFV